jgi:O-antigen ligase
LFILLNAVLFIRPAEIVPDLLGLPIYEWVILACLATSIFGILRQLRLESLASQPIVVCVLGLLAAAVISFLAQSSLWGIHTEAWDFFKVVLYFLLFVSNVTSPSRLRHFLGWLLVFILALTVLALLNFYDVIDIPSLARMKQTQSIDEATGEIAALDRLCSTGIYANPNSLSRILLVGLGLSLYWLFDRHGGLLRLLGLISLGTFGFAMVLTYSRGGFVGLMVGVLVFLLARFGWRKSLPLAVAALALLFILFAGRQTDLDVSEGTGQQRLQIWSEGLALFIENPLFGIGMGNFEEEVHIVAHNCFVHCYTELGFLGGTLFTGAVYLSLWPMYRLSSLQPQILDPELRRLRPYLLAILAGYAAGMLSISISYHVPTYMLFGLAAVYLRLVGANPRLQLPRFDTQMILRLGTISASVLAGFHVYVRLFVHWI